MRFLPLPPGRPFATVKIAAKHQAPQLLRGHFFQWAASGFLAKLLEKSPSPSASEPFARIADRNSCSSTPPCRINLKSPHARSTALRRCAQSTTTGWTTDCRGLKQQTPFRATRKTPPPPVHKSSVIRLTISPV